MTTRLLPPEEWHRVADADPETGAVMPHLSELASVIVVEHEGAIVGCWILHSVLHAECLWIAPAHRKRASVGRRLWFAMREIAREVYGVRAVAAAAVSEDVKRLHVHAGSRKLPGEHYLIPVR